ncbi:MAG: hypothetical protein E3J96_05935 [Sulfurovum sp.]|nr:MAG: hypothetical protein E3J96_05935 [Sulfurovum sp.]
MEKEFKEIIEQSKKSLEKAEKKIEELSEDFTEEAGEFWVDLKKRFAGVNDKLKDAYTDFEEKAELKGQLGMMEARDRVEKLKEATHEFTYKVSTKAQEELDIAALKAHLAKMESEDLWEEKQKEFSLIYQDSKIEAEKLAKKAGKEINEVFLKLTEMV